jgi:hypothetical protein
MPRPTSPPNWKKLFFPRRAEKPGWNQRPTRPQILLLEISGLWLIIFMLTGKSNTSGGPMKKALGCALIFFSACFLGSAQNDEILNLKEKIIEIQNKGELGFRNFTFCSNIIGFGSYVPLADPVLDKSGELFVYYEPVNVFTSKKEGLYEIWYTQSMALLSENGEVLQDWPNAVDFHYTTRAPVLDLFAQNSITLGGQVPPGKYKFRAVLKDKLSGKSAIKVADFEVR